MGDLTLVSEAELRLLPTKPGVYIMRAAGGEVLYVGKARSLRNRVRSYFQPARPQDPRIQLMVSQIDRLDYITVGSEVEALALESNLIKEHHPKYNVKLRDDKQYPLLKVSWEEDFPRLLIVRRVKNDGGRYFGPYTDSGALRDTLKLLRRLFPVRSCKKEITGDAKERPCLNSHIGRCLAPCAGGVTREEYRAMVDQVCLFLRGRQDELARSLQLEMEEAAGELAYERAAVLRDRLADLARVIERQKVVSTSGEDLDVLGVAAASDGALILVFRVRGGKLLGRDHFLLTAGAGDDPGGILEAFILQHYGEAPEIPPDILLPAEIENAESLEAWLGGRAGRRVRLAVPKRGEKKDLVAMAGENAAHLLEQERTRRSYNEERAAAALALLAGELGLVEPPRRIEAFDISNIQGREAVASMTVLLDGRPAPKEYRRFRIRTVEGANDFAMLQEAVGRRFRRGLAERAEGGREGFAAFPDLLLIDGGKGQLGAVLAELEGLADLAPPATIGLAKENEEIYLPGRGDPLVLPRDSAALHLLQWVRDEAHRFAVTYHRTVRGKNVRASALDGIAGVGPRRKQILLRHFGSVRRIMEASLEELAGVQGMTAQAAEAVYRGLRKTDGERI